MSDPRDAFDQLGAIDGAGGVTDVDPVFAARLRARVERALGAEPAAITVDLPTRTGASRTVEPNRSTMMNQVITPYLCVHDASAALDWYREFFGASIGDVIEWEGRIGHAELDVSGAVFHLSDEAPGLGVVAPNRDGSQTSVSVVLQVAVVEEFVARAERGGAVVQRPIEESHGSRNAWLVDPFGHRWNVATPVYDDAQIAARRGPSEPYYMTWTSPDPSRAAEFYGAVFGWESVAQDHGGHHVTNTEMPIGLRAPDNPFGNTEPGEISMWFTVRDFDDALERVTAAGGSVVEVNGWDSGREAVCVDDQGVTFRFNEPAPGYDR